MKQTLLLFALIWVLTGLSPGSAQVLHKVTVLDSSFDPPALTINVGDTVLWEVDSSINHTVTSGEGCTHDDIFDSGSLGNGETFYFVFTGEGSFSYYCIPHCGAGMTGEVFVEDASTSISETQLTDRNPVRNVLLHPNPAAEQANLSFQLFKGGVLSVEIRDITGQKTQMVLQQEVTAGEHNITLPTKDLASGIYILQLRFNNNLHNVSKLVKR